MKIGIITFHYSVNYGAVLQAYALSCYLTSMGHKPSFINYVPKEVGEGEGKSMHRSLKASLMDVYITVMARYSDHKLKGKFDSFLREYLSVGDWEYHSIDELKKSPPEFDVYVCGSDQIWNPHEKTFDPASFLMFGDKNIRRISYAASFGTPVIAEHLQSELRVNLSGLDHISVRESSGVEIVKKASQRDSVRVLDPTLLLDKYPCSALPKYAKGKYVFVYRLQQNHSLTKSLTSVIKQVSTHLGERVINASPHRYRFFLETGRSVYPAPSEWVGLMEHALFVVTNSFHGTVFAIVNQKPFISFPRVNEAGQNGRMQELLSELGLEDRFITPDNAGESTLDSLVDQKIDWESVQLKLGLLRKESHSFLAEALGESSI